MSLSEKYSHLQKVLDLLDPSNYTKEELDDYVQHGISKSFG
jgi:hypothetical protein